MSSEFEHLESCRECEGDGTITREFKYKNKTFHYYEKCTLCRGKGEVDWVRNISGRKCDEWFFDNHPAGSLRLISSDLTKQWGLKDDSSIYDGKTYIPINSERGEALFNYFHEDEEDERV